MRIAIINWTRRRVGGTETYLGLIVPALLEAGHEVAFWSETDLPLERELISLPDGVPVWDASALGTGRALQGLGRWRPDIIYAHGLLSPKLEAKTMGIAPGVFFAHGYYGTCISGAKTFKRPVTTPCSRQFGLKCMLQFYPNGCGGGSPITMISEYRRQSRRLELLRRYSMVLTHSMHMREEYVRHGFGPDKVHVISYYAHGQSHLSNENVEPQDVVSMAGGNSYTERAQSGKVQYNLLFAGRMDRLKGGRLLLKSLPEIAARLGVRVRATFAGDGPDRPVWEGAARRLQQRHPNVEVIFTGWVARERLDALLDECDLLIFPSQWPEPFGLAGPEAGFRGVPVAAFNVGGISDWLIDGINGYLAPGDPPTAGGLTDAVVKCLADPVKYMRLRHGAATIAHRFQLQNHLSGLLNVFEKVLCEVTELSPGGSDVK